MRVYSSDPAQAKSTSSMNLTFISVSNTSGGGLCSFDVKGTTNQFEIYCTPVKAEAEFLDVIGDKVLRVFLLALHSHLY